MKQVMDRLTSRLRKASLAAILVTSAFATQAQDSVVTKFRNYRKEVYQEKLFLHIDRDVYLTGETLWLKVYDVDASFHKLGDLSKVAYVEIVDRENVSLVQEKIELVNGTGSGSLFLPASLSSGTYMVRAYTNWMKNFSADYYFKKPVTIVNSFVKVESTTPSTAPAVDVQFFPEGGNLLAGVPAKVGFKALTRQGLGTDFRGALVDDSNDTLVRFKPLRFGMGSFSFTPTAGKKYRAIVRVAGNSPMMVNMPAIAEEGYSMKVDDNGDVLNVEVSALPVQTGPMVYLLAHTRQQLAKAEKKTLSAGKVSFQIKKSDLKDGVSHITVFNERSNAVAERLYFMAPKAGINISLQSSQTDYRTRTKVTLDVQTDRAVPQMSISVYKLDSLASSVSENHINDYLYLTSDLRGLVESPEFYFSNNADATAAAENLMLTQGWRRFNWKDVLGAKPSFSYSPEYHGHFIKGITKDLTGQIAPNTLTYLSVPGKLIDVYSSRSNSKGEVSFEMRRFIGGQKVITFTDSLHTVELLTPFSKEPTAARLPEFKLSPSIERNLLARSVAMQVQNIYYDDHYATPSMDSSAFYGKADETYYLDEYTRFPVMEEVMREYVPGVFVRKQRDGFRFFMVDVVNKKPINETPMILVDAVPVFDEDVIMAYDPLKVKKLEVVTRKFYHGLSTFPGIISYTTYNGNLDGFELDKRYVNVNYEGLQLQREFYSPKHEYEKDSEARLPDQRSLLYWDPTLSTEGTNKQNPQFFTSDVPGIYQVVVEGLTEDGAAGTATMVFKVLK